MSLGRELPAALRRWVGDSWATRTHVEECSTVQFERLSHDLEALHAPHRLVEVAQRAIGEEAHHRELCHALALSYGVDPGPRQQAQRLAPPGLPAFETCLYAAVAHCCVAETESVATLTELIRAVGPDEVRSALVRIARDEVQHAQLGWAVVTWAVGLKPLGFLAAALPRMLEPGGGPLFRPSPAEADDERLRAHGVLPMHAKRSVFIDALEEVLLPGFARAGIDGASARAWLDGHFAPAFAASPGV